MEKHKKSGITELPKSAIGNKIKQLMELNSISLSRVAAATGLTAETIRQIVNGSIKNPGIETLSKIANSFSISLFDLLGTRNISPNVGKRKIKIIDIFDLQKSLPGQKVSQIIKQSVEYTEMLYIDDNIFDSDFFAIEVNMSLAEKLSNSGMPLLKKGNLLIFKVSGDFAEGSIILARHDKDTLMLAIVMEVGPTLTWVKSVDIPQRQVVMKITNESIVGAMHNVQFTK